ncbi:MAG TPA: molybdate ABC transporter substrate-binding protein [Microbacterium sp.]|nr:molybdate ABC transporter substrate-binding protein [Microbacterium sp.]
MRRIPIIAVATAAIVLLLGGCASTASLDTTPTSSRTGGSDASGGGVAPRDAPSPADADVLTGELSVSAAASLKGAFDQAIAQFEKLFPGVHVTATYDGSSTLATQIDGGAKVDVFASADEANMARVTGAGLASGPTVFARNTLVVVTPKSNPAGIKTLADLAKPGVKVVLCAPEVPCGAASKKLLAAQRVTLTPVSQEQNVTAVLTKVRSDEADAGLVYKTDAAAATADVRSFTPTGADQVVNAYPIVALKDAPNPDAATTFVSFITGTQGQKILASFGFDGP